MPFLIYNTQTQKKEIFTPLSAPQVKMYCCGPTVYDFLHIGNFRGAVFFNFLRQWLEYKEYKVTYVYNFTDVDDKILNRAIKEKKSMQEISEKYISEFKKDFQMLKLKPHEHNPRATEFISNMVELIQILLKKKRAYIVDQDVFFSINSLSDYGKLSRHKGKELLSGVRVEVDKRKQDPRDFALWKSCKKEESGWEAPWGYGRPGWHTECTSMVFGLLGGEIDIHGGGSDLIFPHHENELAQAEGARSGSYVKYWVHNNMFTFGGEKMAKSTGNVSIMRTFLEEYHPEIFKYLVLSSHYRSMIEVSENKILQCIQALHRIYTFLSKASLDKSNLKTTSTLVSEEKDIEAYLDDDLNTPAALAVLFTLIRQYNDKSSQAQEGKQELALTAKNVEKLILKYGKVMSLFQETPSIFLKELNNIFLKKNKINPKEVDALIVERDQSRKNRDFKRADEIKAQLIDMNVEIKDSPTGTIWEAKKI